MLHATVLSWTFFNPLLTALTRGSPNIQGSCSYLAAIDLFTSTGEDVDLVVLLRFELFSMQPLSVLNVEWDKVNFRDRDEGWDWGSFASDLLFIVPAQYLQAMRDALDWSGNNCHQYHGCGHFAYRPLRDAIGEDKIHFINEGIYTSMTDAETTCSISFLPTWSSDEPIWSDTTVPRQRVQPAAQPLPGRNTDLWKSCGLTSVRRVWNIATAAARDATVAIVSTTTLATSHASNSAARTTVHTSNSAMGAALLATWIAFAVDAALATEREWIGRAIWNWQSTWNGIVPHWRVCAH